MKIYIDGKYFSREKAMISVFDHGLLYGDGVFEGIRVYNGKVFKLHEHITRLYDSAKAIALDITMKPAAMESAVLNTVAINKKINGYIRLIVTRGVGRLGIDPASCRKATVVIIVGDIQLYPEEHYRKGIDMISASTRRIPADGLEPRVKSLNYLNNILARIEAKHAGCIEAVMLNTGGFVAECTVGNIFIVSDTCLRFPAPYHGALEGITMRTVIDLAGQAGIEAREGSLTRYDLYTADECFLTGTGAEIMPVRKIDGRIIGKGNPGPVTKKLTALFKRAVNA
jgi:branched-chain amino acid aminotransferase